MFSIMNLVSIQYYLHDVRYADGPRTRAFREILRRFRKHLAKVVSFRYADGPRDRAFREFSQRSRKHFATSAMRMVLATRDNFFV